MEMVGAAVSRRIGRIRMLREQAIPPYGQPWHLVAENERTSNRGTGSPVSRMRAMPRIGDGRGPSPIGFASAREVGMRISEFIEECNRQRSPDGVLTLMQRAVGECGFDRYAYCALTDHDRYLPGNKPAPAIALNFPTSWTDYYFERRYQRIDPVIVNAPQIEAPFLWDTVIARFRLTRAQEALMDQAREAKLRDGVGVPLHGPFGSCCLLTFAAGDGHGEARHFLGKLGMLSAQFHLAYSNVGRADEGLGAIPDLSARERECLQWLATGRSRSDVGELLHLSENTVSFHVKNAFHKLETNSTILAIVKAIRFRLISL